MDVKQEWIERANCKGTDTEEFFPENFHYSSTVKRICDACEVKTECFNYAMEHDLLGFWGGTSDAQRRRLRRSSTVTVIAS